MACGGDGFARHFELEHKSFLPSRQVHSFRCSGVSNCSSQQIKMAVRASTRISIRWPPAEASEPTDTLVLSIGDYYVDLRVTKSDQSIDWALAGQRLVLSENPRKSEIHLSTLVFLLQLPVIEI